MSASPRASAIAHAASPGSRIAANGANTTGQLYRRNRYYDAASGRFAQEDPLGLAGGLNLYGFANGDPVNFSDPFGLQCTPNTPAALCPREWHSHGVGLFLRALGEKVQNYLHDVVSNISLEGAAEAIGGALMFEGGTEEVGGPGLGLHGNALDTANPAQGYSLRDRTTGEILKYGETTLGTRRYTGKYLEEHNAEMVFETSGTKREMHQWQHERIGEYKDAHSGQRPPLNQSDW